jgi:hypothetical protein
MTALVHIQAEITGYAGQAVNLRAALDPASGYIMISKELPFGERIPGALVVTNNTRGERDRLFTEDDFSTAIRQYFSVQAMKLLELLSAVSKHDPQLKIQTAGFNEGGTRYELSTETTSGNVAVLAIINAAHLTQNANDAMDFAGEISDMFLSI